MGNSITFLGNQESFINKSIVKALEAEGLECSSFDLTLPSLQVHQYELAEAILICIDAVDYFAEDTFRFLSGLCEDKDLRVFAIGKKEQIMEMKGRCQMNRVAGEFYRPINVKDVAEKVRIMLMGEEYSSTLKHILVVDDSGIILNTMQEWLEGKYRVSVVNSAMNAIRFLEKGKPDLILLDNEMPGCSGVQLFEMLKCDEKTADIPVIFLTGKDERETVREVIALNPAGYILKNMPKKDILDRIDAFFEK